MPTILAITGLSNLSFNCSIIEKYDIKIKFPRVDAASPTETNRKDKIATGEETENESDSSERGKEVSKKKSAKIGFRDRKVSNQE